MHSTPAIHRTGPKLHVHPEHVHFGRLVGQYNFIISVMTSLRGCVCLGVNGRSVEQYNFLIPVMKALVDKTRSMLEMDKYLPQLPSSHLSPTFFDDFRSYCRSHEWISFIHKMVSRVIVACGSASSKQRCYKEKMKAPRRCNSTVTRLK